MPGYDSGATQFSSRKAILQFADASGIRTTKTVEAGTNAVTETQLRTLIGAIAAASNAGLVHDDVIFARRVADNAVVAFDEAESSVVTEAVFLFQSPSTIGKRYVRVPAPDQSMFTVDGVTIDPTGTEAAAIIAAAETVFNAGGGDFDFVRGYKVVPGRQTPRMPSIPEIQEPGETSQPPAGPAE